MGGSRRGMLGRRARECLVRRGRRRHPSLLSLEPEECGDVNHYALYTLLVQESGIFREESGIICQDGRYLRCSGPSCADDISYHPAWE